MEITTRYVVKYEASLQTASSVPIRQDWIERRSLTIASISRFKLNYLATETAWVMKSHTQCWYHSETTWDCITSRVVKLRRVRYSYLRSKSPQWNCWHTAQSCSTTIEPERKKPLILWRTYGEFPAPAPVFNTTLKRDCISQIMTYDIIARTTVLSWKHLAVTYSQTLAQGNKSSLYQASSKLPSETTTSITIPTSITITTIKDY